jgi:hypothetical protein
MPNQETWTGIATMALAIIAMPAFFALLSGGGWRVTREVYRFFMVEYFLKPFLWTLGVRWKWLY